MEQLDVSSNSLEIEEQGYTILRGALEPAFVDELVATIDELLRTVGRGYDPKEGWQFHYENTADRHVDTVRLQASQFVVTQAGQRLAVSPAILALAEAVVGKDFLLEGITTLVTGPGTPQQALHADDHFIPIPRPHQPLSINFICALTDFTEENGATRVIPGSHRWTDVPLGDAHGSDFERWQTVPAEMPRGSVLATHTSIIHGGGANDSDARRYAVSLRYCQGWVRPHENLQLALPLDLMATFEPDLQRLLGVRGTYKNLAVGHIGKQDPADVLFA